MSNKNPCKSEMKGLGDLVCAALTFFGVTEERWKKWWGLDDCGCKSRRKWLNRIISFRKSKD